MARPTAERIGRLLPGTLSGALLAIQHIGARDLVVLAAHQGQFDLVLHVLDMKGAALAHPARQRADDFRRSVARRFHGRGGRRPRHAPRPRGTPWSSRPKSCWRRISKPCRCGGSPASAAARSARPSDSGRRWTNGTALASRSRESDIKRPRGDVVGAGCRRGRCFKCAGGKRRHEFASAAGTPRPWTFFRCRGRSPGSQVAVVPPSSQCDAASVTLRFGNNSLLTVAGAAPDSRALLRNHRLPS